MYLRELVTYKKAVAWMHINDSGLICENTGSGKEEPEIKLPSLVEWVAMHSSRQSSQPRNQTQVSCIAGGFFTI